MKISKSSMVTSGLLAAVMLVASGCATNGYRDQNRGYNDGYSSSARCQMCGSVTDVQRVYADSDNHDAAIGTVLGAVIGAVAGHQVGKGKGRQAATVGGAVAGGAIGHTIGGNRADQAVWRVEVRLDDGRYATVTQREDPQVRVGQYVEVRNDRVYRR